MGTSNKRLRCQTRNVIARKAFLWKPFEKAILKVKIFSSIRKSGFVTFRYKLLAVWTFKLQTVQQQISKLFPFIKLATEKAEALTYFIIANTPPTNKRLWFDERGTFLFMKEKVKAKRSFFLSLTLSYCNLSCSKLYVSVYDLKQLQRFY